MRKILVSQKKNQIKYPSIRSQILKLLRLPLTAHSHGALKNFIVFLHIGANYRNAILLRDLSQAEHHRLPSPAEPSAATFYVHSLVFEPHLWEDHSLAQTIAKKVHDFVRTTNEAENKIVE